MVQPNRLLVPRKRASAYQASLFTRVDMARHNQCLVGITDIADTTIPTAQQSTNEILAKLSVYRGVLEDGRGLKFTENRLFMRI